MHGTESTPRTWTRILMQVVAQSASIRQMSPMTTLLPLFQLSTAIRQKDSAELKGSNCAAQGFRPQLLHVFEWRFLNAYVRHNQQKNTFPTHLCVSAIMPLTPRNELVTLLAEIDQKLAEAERLASLPADDETNCVLVATMAALHSPTSLGATLRSA